MRNSKNGDRFRCPFQNTEIKIPGQILAFYSPHTKDFYYFFSNNSGVSVETTDYIKICDYTLSFVPDTEYLIKRQLEIISEKTQAIQAKAKADISKFDETVKILKLKLQELPPRTKP